MLNFVLGLRFDKSRTESFLLNQFSKTVTNHFRERRWKKSLKAKLKKSCRTGSVKCVSKDFSKFFILDWFAETIIECFSVVQNTIMEKYQSLQKNIPYLYFFFFCYLECQILFRIIDDLWYDIVYVLSVRKTSVTVQ